MSDECEACGHDESYHWLEHDNRCWVCDVPRCGCREPAATSQVAGDHDVVSASRPAGAGRPLHDEPGGAPPVGTDRTVYGVWEFHDLVGLYATPQLAARRRQQVIRKLREREPDEDGWDTYVTVSPMLVHGEPR